MRPVDCCCQHPVGQRLYEPPLVPTRFIQPEFASATAEHSAAVTACMSLDAQSPTAVMLPGSRCGPPVYVHVDAGGEGGGGGGRKLPSAMHWQAYLALANGVPAKFELK